MLQQSLRLLIAVCCFSFLFSHTGSIWTDILPFDCIFFNLPFYFFLSCIFPSLFFFFLFVSFSSWGWNVCSETNTCQGYECPIGYRPKLVDMIITCAAPTCTTDECCDRFYFIQFFFCFSQSSRVRSKRLRRMGVQAKQKPKQMGGDISRRLPCECPRWWIMCSAEDTFFLEGSWVGGFARTPGRCAGCVFFF